MTRGIDAGITKITLILGQICNKNYVNYLAYSQLQIEVRFIFRHTDLNLSLSLSFSLPLPLSLLIIRLLLPQLSLLFLPCPRHSSRPPTLLFLSVNKRILTVYRARIICYDDGRHKKNPRAEVARFIQI